MDLGVKYIEWVNKQIMTDQIAFVWEGNQSQVWLSSHEEKNKNEKLLI